MHDVDSALLLHESKTLICLWSCNGRLWQSVGSQCVVWWSEVWTSCIRSGTPGHLGSCRQSEYCVIPRTLSFWLQCLVNRNNHQISCILKVFYNDIGCILMYVLKLYICIRMYIVHIMNIKINIWTLNFLFKTNNWYFNFEIYYFNFFLNVRIWNLIFDYENPYINCLKHYLNFKFWIWIWYFQFKFKKPYLI
jgi:hypothetical protein